jgi:hypothetical protein
MNTSNVENVVMVEVAALNDTKSKRVAKPKLPVKMERNMIFGYWFSQLLSSGKFIDDATLAIIYDKLRIYESLENQTELYTTFESDLDATQKTLRKSIADYHKPPKAPKAAKKQAEVTSDGQVAAQKKGRKKKTTEVVVDNNDDFITQLVAVANSGVEVLNTIVVSPPVTEAVAKTTKPTKKAAAKPVVVESVTVQPVDANVTAPAVEVTQMNSIVETNTQLSTGVQEKTKKKAAIQKVSELVTDVAPIVSEKKPRKKAEPKAKDVVVEAPVVAATVSEKKPRKKAEPKVKDVVVEAPVVAATVSEKKPRKKAEPKVKDVVVVETVVAPVIEAVIEAPVIEAVVALPPNYDDDDDDDVSHNTVKIDESDQEEEEEEEEIHAREFVFNGTNYLIDENTNEIYDIVTQDMIGTYDTESKQIKFV